MVRATWGRLSRIQVVPDEFPATHADRRTESTHSPRDSFRRRRDTAVAAFARDCAEAVDAVAGRRNAARQNRGSRARLARRRGARHRHQPRVLLPHARRVRGTARRRAEALVVPARAVRTQHGTCCRARRALGRMRLARTIRRCSCSPPTTSCAIRRAFAEAVAQAARLARSGKLVTFGIRPAHPETGYGYIECGDALVKTEPPAFAARRFVEKPPLATARQYLVAGNYVWNSGMFCFTPAAIVAAFERHAPECARRGASRRACACRQGERVDARDRCRAVRRGARHLARLRGDGEGGRSGRGRRRARHVRLERYRLVAGGRRSCAGRRAGQPRTGRARRDRDQGHVRQRGRPAGRDGRRRKSRDRRHARRRARRASRSPAAREGSRRRAEGPRPRVVPPAQDGCAAVGRVHGAAGGSRASRSSGSR